MTTQNPNSSFYKNKGHDYGVTTTPAPAAPITTNSSFYPGGTDYFAVPSFVWAWYLPLP
jgi:hypothetical protein